MNETDDHPGPLRAYILVHGVAGYNLWDKVSPLFLACRAHELSHFLNDNKNMRGITFYVT